MPGRMEKGMGKKGREGSWKQAWKDKDGDHSRVRTPWSLSAAGSYQAVYAFACLSEPLGALLNALLASEPSTACHPWGTAGQHWSTKMATSVRRVTFPWLQS